MATLVLDAQPLVTLIADEPGADAVYCRLRSARSEGVQLVVSSVNWCEVLYMTRRLLGEPATIYALDFMRRLPLAVVDTDEHLATYAADMKFHHSLGLGDAFAAALALALDAPLLTADADFLPLAARGLKLDWLGPA